ncbi:hypothetical protein BD779DRAFT_1480439 [Infundibulicybe gibba]|nr:hypothetical protein BD779DRAFT_1480439 [Infundibulicybe gibba]
MPPRTYDNPDPSLIVTGERKRKVAPRVMDNADPLLHINKKTKKLPPTIKPSGQKKRATVKDRSTLLDDEPPTEDENSAVRETVADNPSSSPAVGQSKVSDIMVVDTSDSEPEPEEIDGEDTEESADAELGKELTEFSSIERLSKDWSAPIYAFFKPIPNIPMFQAAALMNLSVE